MIKLLMFLYPRGTREGGGVRFGSEPDYDV